MPAAGAAGVFATRALAAALLLAAGLAAMFLLPNRWWAIALLAVILGAAWEWSALAGYGRVGRWIFSGTIFCLSVALYLAADAGHAVGALVPIETAVYIAGCA